jgi:hypothetical protein
MVATAIDYQLREAQSAVSCTLLYRLVDSPEQTCALTLVLISSQPIYPRFFCHVFQEAH